jgi:hypothetical protein
MNRHTNEPHWHFLLISDLDPLLSSGCQPGIPPAACRDQPTLAPLHQAHLSNPSRMQVSSQSPPSHRLRRYLRLLEELLPLG